MRADPQGAAEMAPKGSSFSLGGGIPPVATYIKPTTIKHEIKLFMMIMIMIIVNKQQVNNRMTKNMKLVIFMITITINKQ